MRRNLSYTAIVLFIAAGLFWIFSNECLQSESEGVLCAAWFEPAALKLRYVLSKLGDYPRYWYNAQFPWYVGFVGFLALVACVRRRFHAAIFWVLISLPILGEWAALVGEKGYATPLFLVGLALLAIFWSVSRSRDDYHDVVTENKSYEIVLLSALILGLLIFRFYALNRIPAGWDTELCVFRIFSSSFDRLWQHESGWAPQTSTGLSWLIINRLLGHFDEPDLYYLYHRFVGCFLSVLKVAVLFLFLRFNFGLFAAFFGASILAFGPPEDWWARVPNFHHWPGLLTVLVIWATINAMQKRTWSSFIGLTLLSITTRWVYPSGMFMVGVPITFFGSLLVFQWSQWRTHFWKISILLIGVIVWVEWLSVCRALYTGRWEALPPILIPSHSEMSGGLMSKLYQIFIVNGADLFSNLFFKQVISTHWTTALTPQPWRSMPSVVGVLAVLATARMLGQRRDKITWLLVIALFFGALPGITSSVADRRIGAMFVILIIMAAREAAWLAHFMERTLGIYAIRFFKVGTPIVLGAYLAMLGGAFLFSTTQGVPRQVAVGKVFQDNVKDNYLLVDLTGQLRCDLFHAVHRKLKQHGCQAGFVSSKYDGEFTPLKLIEAPRFDKTEWWFGEKGISELSGCEDWPTRTWEGVTFVITESNQTAQWLEKLRQRFPDGQEETIKISYIPYDDEPVTIFRARLLGSAN